MRTASEEPPWGQDKQVGRVTGQGSWRAEQGVALPCVLVQPLVCPLLDQHGHPHLKGGEAQVDSGLQGVGPWHAAPRQQNSGREDTETQSSSIHGGPEAEQATAPEQGAREQTETPRPLPRYHSDTCRDPKATRADLHPNLCSL